ncbi:MAG: hypothetical protein ACI4Q9_02410 [Candidatus Methanomethylophilaceae archaeon]
MEDPFSGLRDSLSSMGRAVVCFSGGRDSTVLLSLCRECVGDGAVAFHLSVPMESARSGSVMRRIAGHLGAEVTERTMDGRVSDLIMSNGRDRCYLCKKCIYSEALDLAHSLGIRHVLCGDNSDDDPAERPGMRAAEEMGIGSPFRDHGITRDDVSSYLGGMGLPFGIVKETCLLMRFPVGTPVDGDDLDTVEGLEEEIRSAAGIVQVRARISGGTVRVQTSDDSIDMLLRNEEEVVRICGRKGLGAEIVRTGYEG